MDEVIRQSMTERQFFENLHRKGYEVKVGKDISVRPPGKERFVRLARNFGEDYTLEVIRRRILEHSRAVRPLPEPAPKRKHYRLSGNWYSRKKVTGFRALYFHYCYLLGVFPKQKQEARDLALTMELYTSGSLNIFAHETNVDTRNRIQSYDIHDLGEELKQPGFVTITDAMINRVNYNWAHGKKTHIFVDEFHIAYENEYSGNFFTSAWRQFRKRNAAPCAITQNVEYMLDSVQASTMVSNSEFVVMLNQAESDQERLSKLLNISPEQMSYVNGSEAGCGLMRYGSALVPFVNRFPANTELYKLITTKPGEGLFAKGRVNCNA